jgi:protein-disulfide isomerase
MDDETKENVIALIIVILLVAGIGWWIYYQMYATPVQEEVTAQVPVGASPLLGNRSAPTTVVIFSDFECPFCGEFARSTFPVIKEKYIDTGKVRFVYKQFPLGTHVHAQDAAEASLCANDQDKFWEYHDVLYNHQEALEVENLNAYAAQLGLDTTLFTACLASGQHRTEIAQDKALGTKSGVSGTPTFFINGRRVVGALSAAEFEAQLQ